MRGRPRIDQATQRALARLQRRAHRFHQFAHHPLCGNYASEVVRVGALRLCKGCACGVIGGIAGGIAGLLIGSSTTIPWIASAAATIALVATHKFRTTKWISRLAPAALFALAGTCGLLTKQPLGIAAALVAAAIVGGLRFAYGKRGADRSPCVACPERDAKAQEACSGFAPIVLRERAFARLSGRMIDQAMRRSALSASMIGAASTAATTGTRIERSR